MRAARWSVRFAPADSTGTPATRPATKSPVESPVALAANVIERACSAVRRRDKRTRPRAADRGVEEPSARWLESAAPNASANTPRTRSDGVTPRARACANSAALKPRRSTLIRSLDEGAMNPRLLTCEACLTTAPPRLSLHSPTHSVLARFEVNRPMIPFSESSVCRVQVCLWLSLRVTTIRVHGTPRNAGRFGAPGAGPSAEQEAGARQLDAAA